MHATYSFNFLKTVSEQLIAELDAMRITQLSPQTLQALKAFQKEKKAQQGVYVVHYDNRPVYLGKAQNVGGRLEMHLKKLTGRDNIDLTKVGYKALLLDKSMGTAANESLLISIFRQTHEGMWNGEGFGPKDPGKRRDTTEPSTFDRDHPIKDQWPISSIPDQTTVGTVLKSMKKQLPYVLRYKVGAREAAPVDLTGVRRTAREILQAVVTALGPGWKGVVLSHGMILYETNASYPYGQELLP